MKSLLSNIIDFLNLTIKANLPFEKLYGLTELEKDRYIHYIGEGQSEFVTNFDSVAGTIFWHVYDKVRYSQPQIEACRKDIQVTYPVRLIANIKRSLLECDSASAPEYLTLNLINILANQTNTLRKALGAKQILFEAIASDDNVKGVKSHKDYITVAIDFRLTIIGSNECLNQNACIDFTNIPVIVEKVVCPTIQVDGENIPNQKLVNLVAGQNTTITIGVNGEIIISSTGGGGGVQSVTGLDTDNTDPANPVIQIAVDGVTITGDGTPGNPLVSVGGGGGVQSVTGVLVDNTDPDNPIVNGIDIYDVSGLVKGNVKNVNIIYPLIATDAGANTAALQVDTNSVLSNVMLEVARFNSLGNDLRTMVYVQSVNKLYVRRSGGIVSVYDCDSYEILANIATGGALGVDYIPTLDEVWASSTTTGTARIDISANTIIGYVGGSSVGSKRIEYTNIANTNTSVYCFVVANSSAIAKTNLATLVTSTLNWSGNNNTAWAALCMNPSSAMHRHIVTARFGVSIWDPETDTQVLYQENLSGLFSNELRGIEYSPLIDCFIVADSVNNIVVYLQPLTTSTFTVVRVIRTTQVPTFIVIDETNGLLLISHQTIPATNNPTYVSKFRLSDGKPLGIVATGSITNTAFASAYMCKKGTQSTVFVSGNNTATGVFTPISEIKYL